MAEKDWPRYASSLLQAIRKNKDDQKGTTLDSNQISMEYSEDSDDVSGTLGILGLSPDSDAARLIVDLRTLFLKEQARADVAEKHIAEMSAQLTKKASENNSLLVSLKVEQDKVLSMSKRDDDQRMIIADLKQALQKSSPPSPTTITATNTLYRVSITNNEEVMVGESISHEGNTLLDGSSLQTLQQVIAEKDAKIQALESNTDAFKVELDLKNQEIIELKENLHEISSSLKYTEEKLRESTEKLEVTDERASFFSYQVTEYKGRLESWLTEANEERRKLQTSLEAANQGCRQKEETIIVLRKSLVESLALLKPLRRQVACTEQDVRGLKRRLGSSQLYAYDLIDTLEDLKRSYFELQAKFDFECSGNGLLQVKSPPHFQELHNETPELNFQSEYQEHAENLEEGKKAVDETYVSGEAFSSLQEELRRKTEELDNVKGKQKVLQASLKDAQRSALQLKEKLANAEKETDDMQNFLERLKTSPRTRSEMDLLQAMEECQASKVALEAEKSRILSEWPALSSIDLIETELARLHEEKSALLFTIEKLKSDLPEGSDLKGNFDLKSRLSALTQETKSLSETLESMKLDHKLILSEKNRDIRELVIEKERISKAIKDVEEVQFKLRPRWEVSSSKELAAGADRYEYRIRQLEAAIAESRKYLSEKEADLQEEKANSNAMQTEIEKKESELSDLRAFKKKMQKLHERSIHLTKEVNRLRTTQMEIIAESERDIHDSNEEKRYLAESIQRLKDLYSYVPREITIVEQPKDVIESLGAMPREFHPPLSDDDLAEGFSALETRLFELGCLYQVTKNKLNAEVRSKKLLEDTLQQLIAEADEMRDTIDSLSNALEHSEAELLKTKRMAKDAFVQVDDLTRVINKRRGELRRRGEPRQAVSVQIN